MKPTSHTMNLMEWGMLFALSLVWGGSFFFAAVAVQEIPPMTVAFIRVAGAAIILQILLRLLGFPFPKSPKNWRAFFAMGLINNVVPFSLIFWAQTELASGVAAILNAMTPIFTVIAAHFLTQDEPMTPSRFAGVVLGFIGVFILMGGGSQGGSWMPYLAVLCGGISYALASIYGKRFIRMGVPPLATAAGQVTASAFILFPIILFVDQPWALPIPSLPVVLSISALAVLSTAFAYFLYFRILSTAGATNLALVTFLIPPSAIILGVFLLGETLESSQILGMAVIATGLIAIDGRCFRFWQTRATKP